MTLALGTVPAGTTVYIPFSSYAGSTGASVTLTGLAVTDIEIYKNGSATQRASDAGYALLDTDGIDFDGITGLHGFSVDLSDNTDAGFYAVGASYMVAVSAVTVDGQTVNFWAAVFRIGPAESVVGYPKADISHFGGAAGTFSGGRPEVNTTHAAGTAWNSGAIAATTLADDAITAAKIADGAIDAATFAAGAIDASAIASNAIGASELATDAVTEIVDAVWAAAARTLTALDEDSTTIDLDATIRGAVGLASADLDTQIGTLATAANLAIVAGYIDTEVAAIKAVTDKLDNTLTSTSDGYVFSGVALQSVWDEPIAGHLTTGTTGASLNAAGSAGDPWSTALPGSYGDGTAGAILYELSPVLNNILNTSTALQSTLEETSDGWAFTSNALEFAPTAGLDAAGVRAAVGLAAANLDTQLSAIDAKTTNLPSDPADQSLVIAATTAIYDRIGAPAGASVSADVAAVKVQTAAIETDTQDLQTRVPAALVSGRMDASVGAMQNDVVTAASVAANAIDASALATDAVAEIADAVWDEAISGHVGAGSTGLALRDADLRGSRTVIRGTVDSGASTTSIPTSAFSPAGASADQFKGRIVIFDNDTTTAALRGEATDITASTNSATPTLTVSTLSATPAAGDTFTVV